MKMMQPQRALELFAQKYNCAQSVYGSCTATEGLTETQRLAIAAGFGGGVARQGEVCGALTGALMALGEACGEAMVRDPENGRKDFYDRAQRLVDSFRQAHGSILCRELTGCILGTEEGKKSYDDRELHKNLCSKLVAFASEKVDEIISEALEKK
jgi:C_GCAxxG_C_C family probable redox protein